MIVRLLKEKNILVYSALVVWLVYCTFPFFWTILTSIKEPVDAFSTPPVWVFEPTVANYAALWLDFGFGTFLWNSVIVTLGVVVISLSIGCLAGYALARYSGKLGFWLLMVALIFRSLPHTVFLIPYYEFTRMVGLYDTHIVLIMILVAINQPFTIWMMRSFFMNIPKELEESAMMDGCNQFQSFIKAIVPVMWPGIITTGLFTFLLAYNEFLIPLTLTATNAATMPVAISQFGADDIKYWSMSAAGAVSITLPIVALIVVFQKRIVSGLVAGAVKG
ncbi:carbohydrate ABC transporter permease [Vibrio sp. FNV 38]|nr:carbohydrate ABC transporter permease [Vibrio sp. FNV 38]